MDRYPVSVRARRAPPPGRWLWLVKWVLLVPHAVVLAVLWVAFVVLTLVAYLAVLVTGRYPAAIFAFNVGVLRWTWRVGYYGYQVLGTDRYPPFTLADVPEYPAGLVVDGPPRPPRWLPLVAWLLALPHLLIVAAVTGGVWRVEEGDRATGISLVGVAVLIAGIALLFTGRHPRGLYDLLVGVARWMLRTIAYVALLTDRYPPFRLDQGPDEPDPTDPPDGPVAGPTAAPVPTTAPMPAGAPGLPPAGARPPRAGSAAVRVVALVSGVLLLFAGLGLGAGGTALLVLDGHRQDGYLVSESVEVHTTTAALTAEGIEIQVDEPWRLDATGWGDVRLSVTAPGDRPVFVGVAAESDVDGWLAGTAHEQVSTLFDRVSTRLEPGEVGPVAAPAGQDFWLASASGTGTLTVDWPVRSGRFAVVLANADGSADVRAEVVGGVRVPDLTVPGAALLAAGVLLALAAVALIYVGAAGLGAAPATGGPAGPGPYPGPPGPGRGGGPAPGGYPGPGRRPAADDADTGRTPVLTGTGSPPV